MVTILVAEDDRSTNMLVRAVLRRAGYESLSARDGAEARNVIGAHHVDLVVCDVMMPNVDGLELLRWLRAEGNDVPVLMLTARAGQGDKNAGLAEGADDYLTKPFDNTELTLRVKALLRRANVADSNRVVAGAAVLDASDNSVTRGGERQELPPREFQLLFKLLSSPGRTFTRMQLLDDLWGWDTQSSESTVNVHVNRLRTRFAGWDDFKIETVRGIGYRGVVREEG